jgi:hypothetical protein
MKREPAAVAPTGRGVLPDFLLSPRLINAPVAQLANLNLLPRLLPGFRFQSRSF